MTTPYVDPQTVHNPSTGSSPPAAWGDTVRNGLEYAVRTPGCVLRRLDNQALAVATFTAVIFDESPDLRDTDNFHSTVTNPSRVTIPAGLGGWYRLTGWIFYDTTALTGSRILAFKVNGTLALYQMVLAQANPSYGSSVNGSWVVELQAGDYVELMAHSNSGTGVLVPVDSAGFEVSLAYL